MFPCIVKKFPQMAGVKPEQPAQQTAAVLIFHFDKPKQRTLIHSIIKIHKEQRNKYLNINIHLHEINVIYI